jgi:hypothetical protein
VLLLTDTKEALPVDPAENLGIIWISITESNPVCPVLSQAMFFSHCLQSRGTDCHLHLKLGKNIKNFGACQLKKQK